MTSNRRRRAIRPRDLLREAAARPGRTVKTRIRSGEGFFYRWTLRVCKQGVPALYPDSHRKSQPTRLRQQKRDDTRARLHKVSDEIKPDGIGGAVETSALFEVGYRGLKRQVSEWTRHRVLKQGEEMRQKAKGGVICCSPPQRDSFTRVIRMTTAYRPRPVLFGMMRGPRTRQSEQQDATPPQTDNAPSRRKRGMRGPRR